MHRLENKKEINCIFFSEFHPIVGPRILFQVPEDSTRKDDFESFMSYIIPKPQLQINNQIISFKYLNQTIIGCPVKLENEKYERNQLCFNACFVLNSQRNCLKYENVVRKLSSYLTSLELETKGGFISNSSNIEGTLKNIFQSIYDDLNNFGQCHVVIDELFTLHLQVSELVLPLEDVKDEEVPTFLDCSPSNVYKYVSPVLDIATKKVVWLIDGVKHVKRIAIEADMDLNIVKYCIIQLINHKLICLLPLFQYSNIYVLSPKIINLINSSTVSEEIISFCSFPGKRANFCDILNFLSSLNRNSPLSVVCSRINNRSLFIDEKKLIQYCLLNGFIRRLYNYPMKIVDCDRNQIALNPIFNGSVTYDGIRCKIGITHKAIDDEMDNSAPTGGVCWR